MDSAEKTRRFFRAVVASLVVCGVVAVAATGLVSGCRFVVSGGDRITILTWNVENLFDAVDQGSEYPEFTAEGGWTERDYQRRLQRLSEAVHALRPRPDILVLVEIENGQVLDDLMDDHLVDIDAPYRAFARGPGAAIGIALASRYPITDVRTHLARAGDYPPLRPVLETRIDLAGEPLVVFSNHWKSKRGGAPATEPLRRASARLLAARLNQLRREEPDLAIVVTGDFNERPQEYVLTGRSYPTALMPADEVLSLLRRMEESDTTLPSWVSADWWERSDFVLLAPEAGVAERYAQHLDAPVLVNLWDQSDASGSYYFINRWERIDSMFLSPTLFFGDKLRFDEYLVACARDGCDAQKRPLSWQDDSRGVSDHLPLLLTLQREETR